MTKFNKQFEYQGYTFNTTIEKNTKLAKTNDDLYVLTTNELGGGNFCIKDDVRLEDLDLILEFHENKIKEYVSKREGYEDWRILEFLTGLGFTKG